MLDQTPGSILRQARRQAGLSQAQLASRAGITQSVVSAYETEARQPSLPTLARLIDAAGLELVVHIRPSRAPSRRLAGRLGSRLSAHRAEVRRVAAKYGLSNLRVFGSVARGEDTGASDIDLLVDVAPGVGLLGLARCQRELQALLGTSVDLVPARGLKTRVARSADADAFPL